MTADPAAALCSAHVVLSGSTDEQELVATYLDGCEKEWFAAMAGRRRIPWLLGRVAAKHAVHEHLTQRNFAAIDPTRIVVENDVLGCPILHVRGARLATRGIKVSIAHKPTVGVAVAARFRPFMSATCTDRPPTGIGIDVESIDPRPASFECVVLSPSERRLAAVHQDDRDTWLTRVWTVKEAVAKATGRGLKGRPRDFEVDATDDNRMHCEGRWVTTKSLETAQGRFIVAWTETA
jgi:phosphopantetheine--protein transferase-like protein